MGPQKLLSSALRASVVHHPGSRALTPAPAGVGDKNISGRPPHMYTHIICRYNHQTVVRTESVYKYIYVYTYIYVYNNPNEQLRRWVARQSHWRAQPNPHSLGRLGNHEKPWLNQLKELNPTLVNREELADCGAD